MYSINTICVVLNECTVDTPLTSGFKLNMHCGGTAMILFLGSFLMRLAATISFAGQQSLVK